MAGWRSTRDLKRGSAVLIVLVLMVTLSAHTSQQRPNIVLISVDTLRADHLPCYGYPRQTAPALCDFANESLLFSAAYAQAQFSGESYGSLFTSKYPALLQFYTGEGGLGPSYTTLAEIFRDNGYRTAGFVGGKGPGPLEPELGLGQGFEHWDWRHTRLKETVPAFKDWLDSTGEQPFFAFIQGYDVHSPFNPPPPYDTMFAGNYSGVLLNYSLNHAPQDYRAVLDDIRRTDEGYSLYLENRTIPLTAADMAFIRSQYDGEIRFADAWIEKTLNILQDHDGYNNTIIVIFSDHGMNLGDVVWESLPPGVNTRSHAQLFFRGSFRDHNIHVPLIMRIPGVRARPIEQQTELIDLMPTLLHLAEIPVTPEVTSELQGDLLTPLFKESSTPHLNEFVYAGGYPEGDLGTVRTEQWVLLVNELRQENQIQLLNLSVAPSNRTDMSEKYPHITKELREQFDAWYMNNINLLPRQTSETRKIVPPYGNS